MKFHSSDPDIRTIVERALREDLGSGDVTTQACVGMTVHATGTFFAREPMVVAGIELLPLIFDGPELLVASGARAADGDRLAVVHGLARHMLPRERVALNFLQRLSGIATLSAKYAAAVAGTGCRILDTRKTTPGLRKLEKMAVAAGGAVNHRHGLFDAILIKNNHIVAAGGVRQALERVRSSMLPVEIEVRTRAELDEALAAGAQRLLLDNLTPAQAKEWIRHIGGRATVELSGGITLANIHDYAICGAHYISCGAITHSATAVDINFRIELD